MGKPGSFRLPCLQAGGADDSAFEDDDAAIIKIREVCKRRPDAWGIDDNIDVLVAGFFAFYAGMQGPGFQFCQPPFDWGSEVVSIRLGRRERADSEEFRHLSGRHEP